MNPITEIIKSGATSDQLTIDPTSKTARVTLYANDSLYMGERATYRASTTDFLSVLNNTKIFFQIQGVFAKTIIISSIYVGLYATGGTDVISLILKKWSTAPTDGVASQLSTVRLDSNDPTSSTACSVYSSSPTEGTLIGAIGCIRSKYKNSTAGYDSSGYTKKGWQFYTEQPIFLHSNTEVVTLSFGAAPGISLKISLDIEWTEKT